jgi:hypothetical protein
MKQAALFQVQENQFKELARDFPLLRDIRDQHQFARLTRRQHRHRAKRIFGTLR